MSNAAIIPFPPPAIKRAAEDAALYWFAAFDFGKALARGLQPADAAAIAVAEALRATIGWPDEERLKYAEALEREVGKSR